MEPILGWEKIETARNQRRRREITEPRPSGLGRISGGSALDFSITRLPNYPITKFSDDEEDAEGAGILGKY